MDVRTEVFACVLATLLAMPASAQDRFRVPESRVDVGDWSLECYLRADGSPEACQAYHRVLMDNATRIALVASFAVPATGDGVLYQIALPLGIDLLAGVLMTVDGGYAVKLPVTRCTLQGCLLEGRLTDAPYDALMMGTSASFTIQSVDQGVLMIPMSLIGFKPAIERIRAAAEPLADVSDPPVAPEGGDPDSETPQETLQETLSEQLDELDLPVTDNTLAPVTGVTGRD